MVTTPYEALADVGAVWQDAGGIWKPTDPVHFEYPGFSVPQAAPADTSGPNIVKSLSDWLLDLPWYVQAFLPTTLSYDKVYTFAEVQRVLKKFGITV